MTDNEIIEKYHELRSCKAVAQLVGCHLETVRRVLQRCGIPRVGWKQTPEYALPKKKYTSVKKANSYRRVSYDAVCEYCGVAFASHDKRKRFCSKKCKDAARYIEPKLGEKICPTCGHSFAPKVHNQIFCSQLCTPKRCEHTWDEYTQIRRTNAEQNAVNREKKKLQFKVLHTTQRECKICGALFDIIDTASNVTCSVECSKALKRYHADKRIPDEQRRDEISLNRLYKRDGGICYLCGGRCDWNDWRVAASGNKYPGDKYPTIDHVVPVSRGGLDAWENVRLACWKCNIEKGAAFDDEHVLEPAARPKIESGAKRTLQFSTDGELIRVWESTSQIRKELGFNDKRIQNVCRGEGKTAFGYIWKYAI